MKYWFAAYTHAHAETKASMHLEKQGFETFLPRYSKRRSHARKVEWVPAPLFPRYLFIHMDIDKARWRAINSTVGISHLLCQGVKPATVPLAIIDEFKNRQDVSGMIKLNRLMPLQRGDRVRLMSGPLSDQICIFEGQKDEDRVALLLDLLGRRMEVVAPVDAIDKVN